MLLTLPSVINASHNAFLCYYHHHFGRRRIEKGQVASGEVDSMEPEMLDVGIRSAINMPRFNTFGDARVPMAARNTRIASCMNRLRASTVEATPVAAANPVVVPAAVGLSTSPANAGKPAAPPTPATPANKTPAAAGKPAAVVPANPVPVSAGPLKLPQSFGLENAILDRCPPILVELPYMCS
ncbi:hypothetical protein EVG20_g10970 [Dentipellis fragilis]|uniref:Uncharacterized protein n=1 Tax=Dentipellis fragilis TaxID=205917 RepID=A0A4Y9XQ67_9AGAM|nr:hypothetical protein EVG20_g10970 [Dentipellis fragilis]